MLRRFMKKNIIAAIMGCMVLASVAPITAEAAAISEISTSKPGYGMVYTKEGTGVNVRQGPSTSTDNITSLPYLSRVMVVGQSGNFYKVQYDTAGNYGYVSKDYLVFMDRDYYLKPNITSGNLNMRSGAGTSYDVLCGIPRTSAFAWVEDADSEWYSGVFGNKAGYTAESHTVKTTY